MPSLFTNPKLPARVRNINNPSQPQTHSALRVDDDDGGDDDDGNNNGLPVIGGDEMDLSSYTPLLPTDVSGNAIHNFKNKVSDIFDVKMTEPIEPGDNEGGFNTSEPNGSTTAAGSQEVEAEYAVGTFNEEEEEVEPQPRPIPTSTAVPEMLPSTIGSTTEIPHNSSTFKMSEFEAALALYVNKWSVSREQYKDLRGVLNLLDQIPYQISCLPARVDTIKNALNNQLPLLTMRSRELQLDRGLLPTRAQHTEDILLFDMKHFFKSLLQAPKIMSRVHMGMAEYVDQPTEFWHSRSWGTSNQTTSGQFATVTNGKYQGETVLASDFVWFYDISKLKITIGRVVFVGVDKTTAARGDGSFGKVKLSIQSAWIKSQLDTRLQSIINNDGATSIEELFLVEGEDNMRITEDKLVRVEHKVHLDYFHKTATPSETPPCRFCVRYIISHNPVDIRPLALSNPLRGELEIQKHSRARILCLKASTSRNVRSLPYTLFIDAFGLYRNMHRPIPGFYAQFAFMNELDRKRRINVFPITLAPFAAKWEEVVYSLMHLKELEVGVEIRLDNGTLTTVCAPCIALIGDMPQQQANAGCKNQKADHYCRSCLISSKDDYEQNITFDIVANGRYHFETERVRKEANALPKRVRDKLFKKLGLNDERSPLSAIFETLCVPLAFPGDVAHSEFKGIARQVLNILFTDILKPTFHEVFARQFAATIPPPTWPQIQNIHKYIGSYSMQEFGRASMITPVTLRKWLEEHHLRAKVPAAIDYIASTTSDDSSGLTGVDFLVHCYATIARMNAVVMGPYIRKEDRINLGTLVREARRRMQNLVDIAFIASNKEVNHTAVAYSDTPSTSPLGSKSRHSSRTQTLTYKAANPDVYNEVSEGEYVEVDDPLFGEEEEVFVATLGRISTNRRLTQSQQDKKRLDSLQRKKYTPNVHTILHVLSTVDEYASARNVTTWSGEDKHK